MSSSHARLRRSDAQLNVDALERRGAPYRVEHEASRLRTLGRQSRSLSLRSLARSVVREFALEAPAKTTDGLHHLDSGGAPEFSADFLAYLESSPDATDRGDADDISRLAREHRDSVAIVGYYRWPNRAALYLMLHHKSPKLQRMGTLVELIVAGIDPFIAAIQCESHPDDALATARRALDTFVSRRAALRLKLPRRNGDDD